MAAVMVTGGDQERHEGGYYKVPKRDLIVGMQVLLQANRLRIAAGLSFGEQLVEELRGIEIKSERGGERAIRGGAGGDARRFGVRGGTGVLERRERCIRADWSGTSGGCRDRGQAAPKAPGDGFRQAELGNQDRPICRKRCLMVAGAGWWEPALGAAPDGTSASGGKRQHQATPMAARTAQRQNGETPPNP